MYQYKWMKTLIKIIRGINGGSGTSKESRVMNCLNKVFQKKIISNFKINFFYIFIQRSSSLENKKSLEMTTNTHMLIYVKSISMKNMPIFSRLRVEVTFISYDTCKHHKRFKVQYIPYILESFWFFFIVLILFFYLLIFILSIRPFKII